MNVLASSMEAVNMSEMRMKVSEDITNQFSPHTERATGNCLVAFTLTVPARNADLGSSGRIHEKACM